MDSGDILLTNQFIPTPTIEEIPEEYNEDFKKFYMKQKQQEEAENTQKYLNEGTDVGNLLNTNFFENNKVISGNTITTQRKTKEIKNYISIDSRDRDAIKYNKPNFFEIFLGKTFRQVKTVKLVKLEFPNTDAVINSSNRYIYWRNIEDINSDIIDNITKTYPVYKVELRIGSYIASSLQEEISNKLQKVKRQNNIDDFHYFLIDLDIDTDIVTMTSLILTQLVNNPLSVVTGLGLVTVTATNHGYNTGNIIYMEGVKTLAGIQGSVLSGAQEITVLNPNTFQYEVNVKAGDTTSGGGNTVKTGKLAPFQLLFGEYQDTIAPNLGYPLENSSQKINTFVKSINNYYQVKITTTQPLNFANNYNFIGQTCLINNSFTTPNIDGNRVISKIIDSNTILISVNNKLSFSVFGSGQLEFNSVVYDISSIANNDLDTVIIETFTDHHYTLDNIGFDITFYNTTSVPTFDNPTHIYNVLSNTLLVIPGSVLDGGDVNAISPGNDGTLPLYNPLLTFTHKIIDIIPGTITTITCQNHGLTINERVQFFNILTSPSITNNLSGIHTVYSILDADTFTINFMTSTVDPESLINAYIGLAKIQVTFPYHGFNSILLIESVVDLIDPGYNVEITTLLPHSLVTGDTTRIMKTNTFPLIDDGGFVVKVIDTDTFRIIFPGGIVTQGDSGIIGMSNNFYIYGATEVGGISPNQINKNLYNVRDIQDPHTFTFDCSSFATKTEQGGGNNIFISSLKHGFSGVQTNTKNSLLNRSINLEGENYAFLCCPQLNTMMNTGSVKNIFARITLDQSPGAMVFNFLSNPKDFETAPLNELNSLEFSIVNYDGSFYEFNDLDYSMTLEITEIVDTFQDSNYNSRTGLSN